MPLFWSILVLVLMMLAIGVPILLNRMKKKRMFAQWEKFANQHNFECQITRLDLPTFLGEVNDIPIVIDAQLEGEGQEKDVFMRVHTPISNEAGQALYILPKSATFNPAEGIDRKMLRPIDKVVPDELMMVSNDMVFACYLITDDVKILLHKVFAHQQAGLLSVEHDQLYFQSPNFIQTPEDFALYEEVFELLALMREEMYR